MYAFMYVCLRCMLVAFDSPFDAALVYNIRVGKHAHACTENNTRMAAETYVSDMWDICYRSISYMERGRTRAQAPAVKRRAAKDLAQVHFLDRVCVLQGKDVCVRVCGLYKYLEQLLRSHSLP